jgi:TonB family protein
MFEQAAIRSSRNRYGLLTLSAGVHALIVGGALAATLASVDFPAASPAQYARIRLAAPVVVPPAAGSPARPATPHPVNPAPRPAAPPVALTAPTVVPDAVPQVAAQSGPPEGAADPNASGPSTGGGGGGVEGGLDLGPSAVPLVDAVPDNTVHRVGGDVTEPVVRVRVSPEYPRVAIQMHRSGTATVECIVDRNGRVRDVRVIGSTFPPFEQAAANAVRQWVFTPGTLNGRAVDVIFQLTVRFELR